MPLLVLPAGAPPFLRLALVLSASAGALVALVPFGCGTGGGRVSGAPDVDASAVDGSIEMPASWERGANLVAARGCPTCHDSSDPSAILAGSDQPVAGSEAYGANLTPDPLTGVGSWTDAQLTAAIERGVAADGHTLCAQMPRASDMTDADAAAIVLYLRSLPPVIHQVPASVCGPVPAGNGSGDDAGDDDGGDGGLIDTRGTPPPVPGALVISEVMCDPLGPEPNEEWFELHNRGAAPVALRGLTVSDTEARTVMVDDAPDLAAGAYALFVRTREGASMTSLPTPTFVYGEALGSTAGVILTNDSNASLSILVGDVLVDHFPYGSVPRRAAGASVERSEAPDAGAIGCIATTSWAGDAGLGTPSAPNDCR